MKKIDLKISCDIISYHEICKLSLKKKFILHNIRMSNPKGIKKTKLSRDLERGKDKK